MEAILTPVSTNNWSKSLCLLVDIIPFYRFQSACFRGLLWFFRGDYVALDDPFLNVQRVKARVENKGHFVEPAIVVRRYHKSMQNLNEIISFAKGVYLFDNTFSKFRLIASLRESGARKEKSVIVKSNLPQWSDIPIVTLVNKMKI